MKIALFENAAFGVCNGVNDDKSVFVNFFDGAFDIAEFEPRHDAV